MDGQLLEFAKYLGGLLVLLSGWLMNRLFNRVSTLEKETVGQKTFNATLGSLREDNSKLTDAITQVGRDYREDAREMRSLIAKKADK